MDRGTTLMNFVVDVRFMVTDLVSTTLHPLRLPREIWTMILKQRSKIMFQERINKLQDVLVFPEQDAEDEDRFSLFLPKSHLYWAPQLLSLSFSPPMHRDWPNLHHLYYFCCTFYKQAPTQDHYRQCYEYEEIYRSIQ